MLNWNWPGRLGDIDPSWKADRRKTDLHLHNNDAVEEEKWLAMRLIYNAKVDSIVDSSLVVE